VTAKPAKFARSQGGQALVEFILILPILLLLGLGVVELANMLNAYLVLTHLTREGANATSRENDPAGIDTDLDTVIAGAEPIIRGDNTGQWTVIYSQIVPVVPGSYQVSRMGSWIRGGLSQVSKIGFDGNPVNWAELGVNPDSITPGQTFHVVEVYYDYRPSMVTPLENFLSVVLPTTFYERAVFTDVS